MTATFRVPPVFYRVRGHDEHDLRNRVPEPT